MRPFYTPHQLRHDHDDILFINEHWGEIKEAYFQVLEALKAPTIETPSTPTPEGGCKCPWVKKTLIPTYFYITLDNTAKDLTDSDVEEIIKNTDVTVTSHVDLDMNGAEIPKQFPLMYLGKTAEGYKYAFPYSLDDSQDDSTSYDTGHEKSIFIQLHNRLSQYNTENSSYMHGLTRTNGTTIYRDSSSKWPATNKIMLSLAAEDCTIYSDLDSGIPQDTAKVYYYKHIDNGIEPTPMTFKFLDTVKVVETTEEDKPEETPKPPTPETPDTPENTTPEGVLTSYTVKVRFTPEYWYNNNPKPKFAAYCINTQTWKEATKVVDGVVYYTFTEEEVNADSAWIFTRHDSTYPKIDWSSKLNQTADIVITFDDTVRNDVVTIDATNTIHITVGKAYV